MEVRPWSVGGRTNVDLRSIAVFDKTGVNLYAPQSKRMEKSVVKVESSAGFEGCRLLHKSKR